MNTLTKRLLTFFIGVPFFVGIIFITYQHYIGLNLAVIIFSCLAANEFYNMAENKTKLPPKPLIIILTGLLPILSYIFIIMDMPLDPISWLLQLFIIVVMGFECLSAKEFTDSLPKIAYSAFCIFYCGYTLTFVSRIITMENSLYFLVLFLLLVFLCDSAAWFFGMLFGKNNRGIFKASPNKSIAGFAGGILSDIALSVLAKIFFSEIFEGGFWKIILLAFITSLAAITGDLIESVMKRSCNVKDSGKLIPGRGGVLDSVDSFIVAAPVFYLGIHFLYIV